MACVWTSNSQQLEHLLEQCAAFKTYLAQSLQHSHSKTPASTLAASPILYVYSVTPESRISMLPLKWCCRITRSTYSLVCVPIPSACNVTMPPESIGRPVC